MIYKVWSSLNSFREVLFTPEFNVILADRTDESDETGSTNGLGKTTLLRIIKFCLGSDSVTKSFLTHPILNGISFGLSFYYNDELTEVLRNTSTPNQISVTSKFIKNENINSIETEGSYSIIELNEFKKLLTKRFINLTASDTTRPTFNEILAYFIRIGKSAFENPTTSFQNQPAASKLVCSSYLLNLNWEFQDSLQNLIDDRKQLNTTIAALKGSQASLGQKSIGELESDRVNYSLLIEEQKDKIEQLNVRDDYDNLQKELKSTDEELHNLINDNFLDQRLLEHYKKSAQETPAIDSHKPIEILKNAGAIFKKETLKTLDEIATFHTEVHRNRKNFLRNEIKKLKKTIECKKEKIDSLSNKKTEILQILKNSGALNTLIELQKSYTEKIIQYEEINAQLVERKRFDLHKDKVNVKINNTRTVMKQDLNDRQQIIDEVRKLFAEYTKYLYGKSGQINVDIKPSGYAFTFTINREGSDGIDQMVVFCFDLVAATLRARGNSGFKTLIHDSTLFADVDPRQYGLALQLAASTAKKEGFQYICCLNSGALPTEHLGDLSLDEHIVIKLTDESDDQGLLGIRLPPVD